MNKGAYFFITLIILLMLCGCIFSNKYPDILYKDFNVVKIQNTTIEGKKVIIVYQIKDYINPELTPGTLDLDTKYQIVAITYYVFKNTDADEVQIICYYTAKDGNLVPYYKFKISRRDAKLAGLLDISDKDLSQMVLYLFSRLKALGELWVNPKLP